MHAYAGILKRIVPEPVRRQINRIRLRLHREDPGAFPSIESTLAYLHKWGFRPRTVVDVGAYRGEWTCLVKRIFPSSQVLMVEPQASKEPYLRSVCDRYPGEVHLSQSLLGAEEGTAVEFVEMETGSSVFEEDSPVPRNRVEKITSTLDSVVTTCCGWGKVDLLKLDVQGYELEVLRGAKEILPNCVFVLTEASLIPTNRGSPLFADVVRFMADAGFRLLDFCSQIRRRDGALWQTDLMFVNERSSWLPDPGLTHSNWWLPPAAQKP